MTVAGRAASKIFYGWWIVVASGIGLAMHFGPIIVPTFGVFLKPLSQEFGWNRAQSSLAFSLATLGIRPRYSEAVMKGKLTRGFRLFEGRFRPLGAGSSGNYFALLVDATK